MPTLPSITVIISSMRCAAYANFCALLLALHATLFFHGTGKPFIRGRRTGHISSLSIPGCSPCIAIHPLLFISVFFLSVQVGFVQRKLSDASLAATCETRFCKGHGQPWRLSKESEKSSKSLEKLQRIQRISVKFLTVQTNVSLQCI